VAKIPLLLLPGTLCDERLWAHQVEHLADVAEPVVVDVGSEPSLGALAERILAEAPPCFALAGLSFGGILALELYRRAPHRISHLALLDTNARADSEEGMAAKAEQWQIATSEGLELLLRQKLIPLYLAQSQSDDQVLIQTIVDMAVDGGLEVFRNQIDAVVQRPDSRPGLASVRCPTLVLCGAEDVICPVDRHEEMADLIPGASLVVVEGCGHIATMEKPEAVTEAMRHWLHSNSG
jgi:pimeloyl-ACP methyl ester carboxylesterase